LFDDIEQRDGYKDLLYVENIVIIDENVSGEGRKRDEERRANPDEARGAVEVSVCFQYSQFLVTESLDELTKETFPSV